MNNSSKPKAKSSHIAQLFGGRAALQGRVKDAWK
jgi:hypothetical protein